MAKNRHWGITVLAILGYIGAVLSLLGGIAMLAGSSLFGAALSTIPGYSLLGGLGASIFILVGVILIAMAVLDYFVARGLWKGQNWARIVLIVFSALGVIGALTSFNIVSLVIDALIIWYIGFYKPAVNYFK